MFTIDFIESKERFKSPLLSNLRVAQEAKGSFIFLTQQVCWCLPYFDPSASAFFYFCVLVLLSLYLAILEKIQTEGWGWIRIPSGVKNVEFPSCGLLWNFRLEFPRSMQNFRCYCTLVPPYCYWWLIMKKRGCNPRGGYERVQQHQISSPGLASLVKACFLQNFYAKGKAANKFSSIVRYW